MPELTYLEAIRQALFQALEADERVFLMGEDVGRAGGVFRVSDGLQARFGPDRVIDTPMAELSIVGIALGAAMAGYRPIAEVEFADFVHAAHEQILNEAAKIRYRSAGDWHAPLVIRMPWGGGIHGGLYHSQSVEVIFGHHPGLKVVVPSTPYDAKGLLLAAVQDPDPVVFLEHKRAYRAVRGQVPEEPYSVPIGQARIAREGSDVTVFAYGAMLHEALTAAQQAEAEGISVEVVDPRTLLPLDRETLLASVSKTGRLVAVHEDSKFLGFGAEVVALVTERLYGRLKAPPRRVAGPDVPGVPFADALEAEYLPDAGDVLRAIREVTAYAPAPRPRAEAEIAMPELAPPPPSGPGLAPAAGPWPDGRHGDGLRSLGEGEGGRRLRLAAWKREAPHVTSVMQVDVSRALAEVGEEGLLALVLEGVGRALERYPHFRARWAGDGLWVAGRSDVLVWEAGRWVLLEGLEGLDRHRIAAALCMDGPQPAGSSTLSVRRQASLFGTPLILEPHAAALAVSPVVREAVAVGEGFAARPAVYLSISIDHRILDGADADRFLSVVRDHLEARP